MHDYNNINNKIITTGQVISPLNNHVQSQKSRGNTINGNHFAHILDQKVNEQGSLRFSKHATQRLAARNIALSPSDVKRVSQAVDQARDKGIKDSLILYKDVAFIVNISSNTVITAMNGSDVHENIFTNIDGAVII